MDFKSYLMRYANKDSPLGDFARDALGDHDFPFNSDYQRQLNYLYFHPACPDALNAFKRIAKNYRRYIAKKGA